MSAKGYINIENNNNWSFMNRDRKAFISSWLYAPTPGMVKFRIDGYNAAGNPVVSDSVWLYIDNSSPVFDVASVHMDANTGGDCALFTVPDADPDKPLTVTFRATHGSMNGYGLTVRKGNIGNIAVAGGPGLLHAGYLHGDDLACSSFEGASEDPTAGAGDYVVANVSPTSGHWLDADQPFCTFAVQLSCSTRVTNGYSSGNEYGGAAYLLGMQQES